MLNYCCMCETFFVSIRLAMCQADRPNAYILQEFLKYCNFMLDLTHGTIVQPIVRLATGDQECRALLKTFQILSPVWADSIIHTVCVREVLALALSEHPSTHTTHHTHKLIIRHATQIVHIILRGGSLMILPLP